MLKDRIVALPTWYSKQCESDSPTPLVDLRSADEFATKRLSFENTELSLVPFPIEVLKERSFELPGKIASTVVGNSDQEIIAVFVSLCFFFKLSTPC
jgi:hypothetical protein